MRKAQHRMILELLQTMKDATKEIKQYFLQKEYSIVVHLLADQQECAVQIADFIECNESEGTQTVEIINDYCKILYDKSVQVEQLEKVFVKHLQSAINRIEASVKSELKPNKLEVLFLSYKASMCDSLESIWLAAKEDHQCDAYFVVIPYNDMLPGKSLGESHYEGHLHPGYIPVTDWQSYDLEQRHPDIIFFYNPYDDGNYVTSVHPDFYSKKLKNHTDLLCYVPYFVTSDNVADHSVTCAGPLNADRVFIESEFVRDKYIQVFRQYEKDNHCEGCFGRAQDKFIASGHPKYDKVINAKQEDYMLPDAWGRLIIRPDGTWKTIVLYNTNVIGLLSGEGQFLSKMSHVFNTFKNRDDAVLWWRPHPLNEATYKSMRPHLADAYRKIIDQYKADGFGIYDDTSDSQRAICLSSMYYGDGSSLLALYQCTGKPIMVHDMSLYGADALGQNLIFYALCDTGRHLWFSVNGVNALCRMDQDSRVVQYMGSFPAERATRGYAHASVSQMGDTLCFAPRFANNIDFYDINTGQFHSIPVPPPKIKMTKRLFLENAKFSCVFVHGTSFYFIPSTYPGILVHRTDTGKTEMLDSWVEPLNRLPMDSEANYAFGHTYDDQRDRILLACYCVNAVLEVNPQTLAVRVHGVGDSAMRFVDIYYNEGLCWLLCAHNPALVRWNPVTGDYKTFDLHLNQVSAQEVGQFQRIVREGVRLLLIPARAKKMIAFDLVDETIAAVDSFAPECLKDLAFGVAADSCLQMLAVDGHTLYLLSYPNKHFIEYNPVTGVLREDTVRLSDPEDIKALREKAFYMRDCSMDQPDDAIFFEHSCATIDDLLDILAKPERAAGMDVPPRMKALRKEIITHADGKAGQGIYDYCKKRVLS